MKIDKLYLHNFLSYEDLRLNFCDGLNVIRGKNASGKTNLLESIYLSSIGKTARNIKDKDLIKWGTNEGANVEIEVKKSFGKFKIELFINQAGQKYIKINSLPISKLSELLGVINVVYFSPDEMKLIKESPVDRRRFLDISLSQQSKPYFYNLMKYNKLLQQRNKLLKDYKDKASLIKMIDLVDQSMMPCVENIMTSRNKFIEKIKPFADRQHKKITAGKESLNINYETEDVDFADIKGSMKKIYEKSFEKDRKLEYTTNGIHRDDLKIVVGDIDVRKFGSQGQQRTAALSLKLAEIFMFHNHTGEYPVLLLDDVLSELDYQRQKALLQATREVQTIVTCTEFDKSLVDFYYMDININDIKKEMRRENV